MATPAVSEPPSGRLDLVLMQPTFSAGAPTALFEAPILPGYSQDSHRWELLSDGQRFLLNGPPADPGTQLHRLCNAGQSVFS